MKNFTKYEYSRLVGARAFQLSLGAPPLIKKIPDFSSFVELAKYELEEGVIPLEVVA
ncbi:DNA-directed RNA polymerase subunit K [Candidatus Micrarchaeota archaeon]|nr:DNA-directed RNA polymerase subunit K [Candidatus Micrarchaeota archaeon]